MNITTQVNQLPLATVVNPPTDSLRRDNVQREVITQAPALSQSAAEKGVASERERARTPAQNVEEGIDFAAIQEQAERESASINERQRGQDQSGEQPGQQEQGQSANAQAEDESSGEDSNTNSRELTPDEQQAVRELSARDLEVRTHEQAHAAVGGPYTGAPSYSFEVGPDGRRYAVEGEVSVDLSEAGSPQETITKMRRVYDAALAPANPSTQDLRVAAEASRIIAQAQAEVLRQQRVEEGEEQSPQPSGDGRPTINSFGSERTAELGSDDASTNLDSAVSATPAVSVPSSSFSNLDADTGASSQQSDFARDDFDSFVQSTIQAQESISPSLPQRPEEIDQRAGVIESRYLAINQAYDLPPRSQFVLQA
ncbi:putative metalloprotease CJM1_0395 family protein [Thalassotalea montiporae]